MNRYGSLSTVVAMWLFMGAGCDSGMTGEDALASVSVWEVQELQRVGSVDGPDALGTVQHVAVDESGQLLILERETRTVRIFDAGGVEVARIGRAGDGPGEFRRPTHVFAWDGETVVWDLGQRRLTWFRDGVVEREQRLAVVEDVGLAYPLVPQFPFPDGSWVARPSLNLGAVEREFDSLLPVVRAKGDGEVLDTIWHMRPGHENYVIMDEFTAVQGVQPFNPDAARGWSPFEPAWAQVRWAAESSVEHGVMVVELTTGSDGPVVRSEVPWPAAPLEDREIDRFVAHAAESMGEGPIGAAFTPAELRGRVRDAVTVPELRPVAQAVIIGRDRTIWVQVTPAVEDGGLGEVPANIQERSLDVRGGEQEGSRWAVVAATGEIAGTVLLPPGFTPMWIGTEQMVGVQVDELGVNHVVRFAIVRP